MPCDASQHPRNPRAPRLLPVALSFQSSRSGVDWLRCPYPHNTTETLIPALECADEEFVTLPSRGKAAAQCPLGGVVDARNRLKGLNLPRYGLLGSSSRLVAKGLTIGGENRLSHRQFSSAVPPGANFNAYAGSACLARLPFLCLLQPPAAWRDSRRGPPLGPAFQIGR